MVRNVIVAMITEGMAHVQPPKKAATNDVVVTHHRFVEGHGISVCIPQVSVFKQ